jgi:holo-[acyl-carrier protein] synthase
MIGVDIVEIKRFDNYRIADNMLGKEELIDYQKSINKSVYVAKRFAAKEACIKATGIIAPMSEIQILHKPSGAPYVKSNYFDDYNIELSISDDKDYAIAFAMATKIYEKF